MAAAAAAAERTHTHATHARTRTECNKRGSSRSGGVVVVGRVCAGGGGGRLLSELLVQLIFVREAGRGDDRGHVAWSPETDSRRGGGEAA